MQKNTVPNPFLWQGKPSIVADAFGRVKSRRQMLLDANRTNPPVFLGAHSGTASALKSKNPVSGN